MDTSYVTSARRLRNTSRRPTAYAASNSIHDQGSKGILQDLLVKNLESELSEEIAYKTSSMREDFVLHEGSQQLEHNGSVTSQVLSNRKSKRWPSRLFSMFCCLVIVSILAVLLVVLYLVLQGKSLTIHMGLPSFCLLKAKVFERILKNVLALAVRMPPHCNGQLHCFCLGGAEEEKFHLFSDPSLGPVCLNCHLFLSAAAVLVRGTFLICSWNVPLPQRTGGRLSKSAVYAPLHGGGLRK